MIAPARRRFAATGLSSARERALERDGARGRRQAVDVDVVLDQHGDAVQRPAHAAAAALAVGRAGVGQRVRVDDPHGVDRRAGRVRVRDPRQVGARQLGRAEAARGHPPLQVVDARRLEREPEPHAAGLAQQLAPGRARVLAEDARRHGVGAAVERRVDQARRLAQLRRPLVGVAEGEQRRLAVAGAGERDVDRAALRARVAGGDGQRRVARAGADAGQRARGRQDRGEVVGAVGRAAGQRGFEARARFGAAAVAVGLVGRARGRVGEVDRLAGRQQRLAELQRLLGVALVVGHDLGQRPARRARPEPLQVAR